MKTYEIEYKLFSAGKVHSMKIKAENKFEAYEKAVYEEIDEIPYSAWVAGYIKKNGQYCRFNTFEGKRF